MIEKKVLLVVFFILLFSFPLFAQEENELSGATLIYAHMDDEILWGLPLLKNSREIIMSCYPLSAPYYNLILNKIDLKPKYLILFGYTSHQNMMEIAHNKAKRKKIITDKELERRLDEFVQDAKVIVTHSPWGEYGHEQHVQVSRVVVYLAKKYHKDLWIWDGIVSIESMQIIGNALMDADVSISLDADLGLYSNLRQTYIGAEEDYTKLFPEDPLGRFWTWDRPWEGDQEYLLPRKFRYVKILNKGNELYSDEAFKAIIKSIKK
jgi:hypothetical protein